MRKCPMRSHGRTIPIQCIESTESREEMEQSSDVCYSLFCFQCVSRNKLFFLDLTSETRGRREEKMRASVIMRLVRHRLLLISEGNDYRQEVQRVRESERVWGMKRDQTGRLEQGDLGGSTTNGSVIPLQFLYSSRRVFLHQQHQGCENEESASSLLVLSHQSECRESTWNEEYDSSPSSGAVILSSSSIWEDIRDGGFSFPF